MSLLSKAMHFCVVVTGGGRAGYVLKPSFAIAEAKTVAATDITGKKAHYLFGDL